ncbi:hypothetical protein KDE13_09150 [Campylobacter sp. faydin G-140]|uniref:hypothetical protein n=1 Tax=Campylobacter anatolicus TaxID=2829105 RepID=UPI001B993C0B|nr:hypothetical protein [Campylobacter anatolicus]MBR8466499.1 hypothetical protein [Campylobacter anatolicus]
MIRLFLLFFALTQILTADVASQYKEAEANLFTADDSKIKGQCLPTCRKVNTGWVALVTDFDPKTGVTYCSVFNENDLDNPLGVGANTVNETCIAQTNQEVPINNLWSKNSKFDVSNYTYKPNVKTMTGFLSGIVTLDPELVNYQSTKNTGMIQLKDNTAIYGTNIVEFSSNPELSSTADVFNKANLAYFSNLYSGMAEVYTALQYMLLVVVGGWFFAVLGTREFNNRVEKEHNQTKVLNTLLIPILTFAVFFIPIPEDSGMNGTIVQKTIRSGANWSNYYADIIGSKGSEVYMDKLKSSVGASNIETEKHFREEELNIPQIINALEAGLNECKVRYPTVTSFMYAEARSAETYKFNNPSLSEKYKFIGCQNIEHALGSYYALQRQNNIALNGLQNNIKNNELNTLLTQIDKGVERRQNELGWINSTMIPALSILVNHIPLITDADTAKKLQEENARLAEKASKDLAERNEKERTGTGKWLSFEPQFLGNLAYFILPGAGEVYNALYGFYKDTIGESINNTVGKDNFLSGIPLIGKAFKAGGALITAGANATGSALSMVAVVYLFDKALSFIPLTVAVVASALAFIGYIMELTKFFYISPFVTAFSLTIGKQAKIVEFLTTGIAIFLKPILIVLFIYLALFLYTLFTDIFIVYAIEQMAMMREATSQLPLNLVYAVFNVLFSIIGTIGATYIMWKTILTAPTWVLKLVGLNNSGISNVTEQFSNRLERYSFQL